MEEQLQDQGTSVRPDKIPTGMLRSLTLQICCHFATEGDMIMHLIQNCSKLYFSTLCCTVDSLSLFVGCTNCTDGCLFSVVEYKPLFVIYISEFNHNKLSSCRWLLYFRFRMSLKCCVTLFHSSVAIGLGLAHHILSTECLSLHV